MLGSYLVRRLIGLAITALVAWVAWSQFGQGILDRIDSSNARSGGGGSFDKRIVNKDRFTPVVNDLIDAAGGEARLVSVTVRPLSVEFVTVDGRGFRWRDRQQALQEFDAGTQTRAKSWPVTKLLPDAPQKVSKAIDEFESGDFHLSLGTLERANSHKLVWVLRGTIRDRGVAYSADYKGHGVKRYNPASPELSGIGG
jgi:hypothetical protein